MTYMKRPLSWLTGAAVFAAVMIYYWTIDEQQKSVADNVLHGKSVRTFSQLDSVLAQDWRSFATFPAP